MDVDRQAIESRLRAHVEHLADEIGPRHLGRPESIQAALVYIRGEWEKMGREVADETYRAMDQTATNLITVTKGRGREDEVILLGAHYDTVPSTPGADDNASAVAVLLEVSRLLRSHAARRTARYVAFACEEPPYFNFDAMGSQHHARMSRERDDKIIGMLCLEMVGYFRDEPGSQERPATIPKLFHSLLPERGDFLAAVGNLSSWRLAWRFRRGFKRASSLPLLSLALPERVREIRLSDNSSFWDQDYPALMLTDTSFLRNPHYHQPSDTPDTLDYPRMTEVVRGVAGAMQRLLK